MRVIDLENINYAMHNETQFVLRCEEVFHDKISAAAAAIDNMNPPHIVGSLAGDDTIFLVMRDEQHAAELCEEIQAMLK